ncbi:Uncharacterized protein QTN25_001971 [Entamoeba marina]
MNVILYMESVEDIKSIIKVSKKCLNAVQELRINPFKISFKKIHENKALFGGIQTIFTLADDEEVRLFIMNWINNISFVRRMDSFLIYFHFPKPYDIYYYQLLSKIQHFNIVKLSVNYINDFIETIQYFKNLTVLQISYSKSFDLSLLQHIRSLKKVYIIFQNKVYDPFIEQLAKLDLMKVDVHLVLHLCCDSFDFVEYIKNECQLFPSININITCLHEQFIPLFTPLENVNIHPNFFTLDNYESVINQSLPKDIKVYSKSTYSINNINLESCSYLKSLQISFSNTKSFSLTLPSSLNSLNIEGSSALFQVTDIPLNYLSMTRVDVQRNYFLTTLTSLSLYQCREITMNLENNLNLSKVGICCCTNCKISVPINISLCGIYFSNRIYTEFHSGKDIIKVFGEDIIHFWYSQQKKIVIEIRTNQLDLCFLKIQYLSFYDCIIENLILPETVSKVRMVNCDFKNVTCYSIHLLIAEQRAHIKKIQGNCIDQIVLKGKVEDIDVATVEKIHFLIMIVIIDIALDFESCKIKEIDVSPKSSFSSMYVPSSLQYLNLNNRDIIVGGLQNTKISRIELLKQQLTSKEITFDQKVKIRKIKVNKKKVELMDLRNVDMEKLILTNCFQLKNIFLPPTIKNVHIFNCHSIKNIDTSLCKQKPLFIVK